MLSGARVTGPAWEMDPGSGQYYLHNFDTSQPDLNWWNPEVRDAFDQVLRFWFERGVDGFRVDVATAIVKDRLLRDDPPAAEHDRPIYRRLGTRKAFSAHQPERHDVFRRWRRICDVEQPLRVLLAEAGAVDFAELDGPRAALGSATTINLDADISLDAIPTRDLPAAAVANSDIVQLIERQPDEVAQLLRSWLADRRG